MPTISLITATYNAESTISDCLQSVATQTYPPVEHIIIDGASIDNTLNIVQSLRLVVQESESRQAPSFFSPITRIISETDNGIYDAMNKGIALVTGEVIGILNADDFYASADVLAKVAAVFENPAVMCCYGDLEYVREQQGDGFKVVRYWQSGTCTSQSWYWGWMPPHPTFFVRKSVYEKYGKFRLDLGTAADYELMLRLLLNKGISCCYIPEVLVRMRLGGASNRSIAARLKANRMDRKAWEVNGLIPYPWTLVCKPLRKIVQFAPTKKAS